MARYYPAIASVRYGYGLASGEAAPQNPDDVMQGLEKALAAPALFPAGGIDTALVRIDDYAADAADMKAQELDDDERRQRQKRLQKHATRALRIDSVARVMQSVASPFGFFERLSAFWFDHFSVNAQKSFPMRLLTPVYEAHAIRPHITGRFRDLLRAAILDPAMLIYLDQNRSAGPESVAGKRNRRGLNENLGRELIELHTMGAGSGYSQKDVRAAAMLLTGVTVDERDFHTVFRPRLAEPGRIDFLGVSYRTGDEPSDDSLVLLDDLAQRAETVTHICRKLVTHFIADEPPVEIVTAMIAAWKQSDGNLTDVYAAMLAKPRAWSDPGMKMKLPFDYVVSGLRALGVRPGDGRMAGAFAEERAGGDSLFSSDPDDPDQQMAADAMPGNPVKRRGSLARNMTIDALARMGQPVWRPPSPAGFEEGVAQWLSASQLSERILWARKAAGAFGADIEPRDMLKSALAELARDDTIQVVSQAPDRVSAMTLLMASPEFNRR